MKEFLDINEVSEYLGIKKSSIYTMVETKAIPFYRIGHLIRFKKSDIDAWMRGLKCEPTVPKAYAMRIARPKRTKKMDVGGVVEKAIATVKRIDYTSGQGKPDIRGLGKEVKHGSL